METHLGKKIQSRAQELRIGPSELGAKVNTSKQNMVSIYKRQSVDSLLLWKISKALDFNFFQYYDLSGIKGTLDFEQAKETDAFKKEIKELRKEVQILNEHNTMLKKINALLEEKKRKR